MEISRKKLAIVVVIVLSLVAIFAVRVLVNGKKGYDSGWISIEVAEETVLEHNLGTEDVVVYLIGKTAEGYVHQGRYGGVETDKGAVGIMWYGLNSTHISVWRYDEIWYHQVRIRIWKINDLVSD